MPPPEATLIIAASEADSNLYYACKFLVPDPIIYFEIGGKKHLVLSDLELDRGREQAQVHRCLPLRRYVKATQKKLQKTKLPSYALIADHLFQEKKIKKIKVPANFPAQYYAALKKLGYSVTIKPDPFYEERLVKTKEEKENIRQALKAVRQALNEALLLLEKSKIKGRKIFYGKEIVTSELLRSVVNTKLMELGYVAHATIVASGVQASLPHHHGHGPIVAHTPIIFDIFPRSADNLYWGDMTRTVVKGRPSDTAKKNVQSRL